MNYKIIKQEGNKVVVVNVLSQRKHEGTLFANGTKVALYTWAGRTLLKNPKIIALV